MKKEHFGLILLILGLIVVSGCATTKSADTNQRIALLSNEITRLDMTLKQTEVALQAEQQRNAVLTQQIASGAQPQMDLSGNLVDLSTNVYRTPSGFQIPARDLQRALKGAGYYNGDIDGEIGPGTRSAIRKFQSDNGLEADGVCGAKTWDKLKTHLNDAK